MPDDVTIDSVIPARHQREVALIMSTCRTCGGRITAQTNAIRTYHTGAWIHMADEDWEERYGATPHHALPTDEGRANLDRALAEQS
jgi:hypothetical protein